MKKHFNLVLVNPAYCEYLRQFDLKVMMNSNNKISRPFVGVLFEINSMKYFAPLSSPKPKHLKMKNDLDFYKLQNGKLGAINFNNMIPVPDHAYHVINMNNDQLTHHEERYKNLLRKQVRFLNRNKDLIEDIAFHLYQNYLDNTLPWRIKKRCCNFRLLEEKYKVYIENKNDQNEKIKTFS